MKYSFIIRNIIFFCITILLALIPFIVTSSLFFPYIVGKNLFFRAIVEIIFVLWAYLAYFDKSARPKMGWVLGAFVGLTIWAGIANFFSVDPLRSFWSNFERMDGYITTLHLFGLFIVVASIITKDLWYRLIAISVSVSSIVWLHGMYEHFVGKMDRIDSGLGNFTYLAAYALIHVFLSLLLVTKDLKNKNIWGTISVLNLITIYYTGTRGALLGVVGGLVIMAILYAIHEWKNPKIRKVSLGIIGLVALFVISLGLAKDTEFVKSSASLSRFSQLATLDVKSFVSDAGRSRLAIWNIAFQGVKDKPLFGWGQENFMIVFSKYYSANMFDQEQWFDRTHNIFFDWLITTGVVGLIAYLLIFSTLITLLWKKKDAFTLHERIIITAFCVAYFIHTFFVFDNIVSYIFVILVWAFVHNNSNVVKQEQNNKESQNSISGVSFSVIVITSIVIAGYINIPIYNTGSNLINGLVYLNGDGQNPPNDTLVSKSQKYFESALNGSDFAKIEIREQLVSNVPKIQSSTATSSTKISFLNMINSEIIKNLESHPNDVRVEYFAGLFYSYVGDYAKAIKNLEDALSNSPKKQTIMFLLANTYQLNGENKKALETYRKAFEVNESFVEPRLYYVDALIKTGKNIEAQALVKDVPAESLMETKYVNFLVGINRYDVIVKIFENELLKNPNNIQIRVSLAAAYVEINEREKAIALLETIVKDIPQSKKQIDYFISEIKAGRNPVEK